jgi:hypothetical protein
LGKPNLAPIGYDSNMTLEAIKEAIQQLPNEERRALAGWLADMEWAAWDAEIERDFAPGGRDEALEMRIRREIAEGKARPLEGGLAKRRSSQCVSPRADDRSSLPLNNKPH